MYDVLIIGAGQAGLAAGYYLKKSGLSFIIVEAAASIGDSWRRRYDSLHLFTPRMYDGLPGMPLEGNQNGLPGKDEIADYLEAYAKTMAFPIKLNCRVNRLWREDSFKVDTADGIMEARSIIVGTGPFQVKNVPSFSSLLSESVIQLHSSEYVNPAQLSPGNTIVVGGGNSGAQIAVELAEDRAEDSAIYLSVARDISFKPLQMMNRSIFWYFDKLGFLRANTQSLIGKWLKKQPEQVYGFELKSLIGQGKVKIAARVINAAGDRVVYEDGNEFEVKNVIWATGFKRDDSWIAIEEAFDADGRIKHNEGISPVTGLYFVGLPWQTSRGSALLGWVKYDAEKIVDHLASTVKQKLD